MNQTIGKREGLQRKPNRADQIGAGFNQDGNIGCASDVEFKLIGMQTKVRVAGVNLRIPRHSRSASETGIRSTGARQIINRQVVVTLEYYAKVKRPRYARASPMK